MSLVARVGLDVGVRRIDLDLDAVAGETVALLGPNGAGKTSALRALSGLLALDRGRIELDGVVLDDASTRTFVPSERRPVGVLFQDGALFPHLDAVANVAFGLRVRGRSRAEAAGVAREWLERLGVGDRASARPDALSGGEAQRVALARALAVEPQLLLLDEPLAALDQQVRADVRRDLRAHLADHPGVRVLVTHDPIDAAVLADRIVVIEAGTVVQAGTLTEITERPRSEWVAGLVGTNLLVGEAVGERVRLAHGGEVAIAEPARGPVFLAVHPHAVALAPERPAGSARNVWPVTVVDVTGVGTRTRVRLAGPVALTAEITAAAVAELGIRPGTAVWAAVKATEVAVFAR